MLQRNITVFLGRIGQLLGLQLLQGTNNEEARVTRLNHIINITIFSCIIRVGKQLGIFGFFFGHKGFRIGCFFCFLRIQYFYGTSSSHYGNLSSRPCIVHIATQLLTAHHDVRTSIRLTKGYCYFRHGSFAVCIQQLRTVQDDCIVFLTCSRQESRNVYQ